MRANSYHIFFFLQHHTYYDDTHISMRNLFNKIININCWLFYTHFRIVIILKLLNGRDNVKILQISIRMLAIHKRQNIFRTICKWKKCIRLKDRKKHVKMPKKAVNSSMKNAVICAKPIKFMGNTCAPIFFRRYFINSLISNVFEWPPNIRMISNTNRSIIMNISNFAYCNTTHSTNEMQCNTMQYQIHVFTNLIQQHTHKELQFLEIFRILMNNTRIDNKQNIHIRNTNSSSSRSSSNSNSNTKIYVEKQFICKLSELFFQHSVVNAMPNAEIKILFH